MTATSRDRRASLPKLITKAVTHRVLYINKSILIAIVLALATSMVHAAEAPRSWIGRLPDSVSLAIEIRDGSQLGSTLAGQALVNLITEHELLPQTVQAWRGLADALGLDQADSFGALLGGKILFISDKPSFDPNSGDGNWAVLAELDRRTENLVKARLKPKPRSIKGGRPIYAIENGRIVFAVGRNANSTKLRRLRRDGSARILLAPARSEALFDSLLPLLDGKMGDEPLQRTRAFDTLENLGGNPDASVLVRWPQDKNKFGVASIRVTGESLDIDTASTAGLLWGPSACCDGLSLWDADAAKALIADSLLGLALVPGSLDKMSPKDIDDLRSLPILGESFIRVLPALGDRIGLAVHSNSDKQVDLVVVAELNPALKPAEAAMLLDARLASAVARINSRISDDSGPNFGGQIPEAIRTAALSDATKTGPPTQLAWRYAGNDRPRWLIARVGKPDGGIERIGAIAQRMASLDQPQGKPRVSVGVGRPADFIKMLLGRNAIIPLPPIAVATAVERIEWDAWLEAEGVVRGVVTLEMKVQDQQPMDEPDLPDKHDNPARR